MSSAEALDIRTERLANEAVTPSALGFQSAQASKTEITQIITSSGVASITGTANQISASSSTGAVTLSTPQNIHTGANPTFAGVVSSASGRFSAKVTSPAQITGNQNDYAPGAGGFF